VVLVVAPPGVAVAAEGDDPALEQPVGLPRLDADEPAVTLHPAPARLGLLAARLDDVEEQKAAGGE
jgi:hypothetical protein